MTFFFVKKHASSLSKKKYLMQFMTLIAHECHLSNLLFRKTNEKVSLQHYKNSLKLFNDP